MAALDWSNARAEYAVASRHLSQGHTVETAFQRGWDRHKNGDLLRAAEDSGFEIFITADKNIRHQQNLELHSIAITVLSKAQCWPARREHVDPVFAAVSSAKPGTYVEIEIPLRRP